MVRIEVYMNDEVSRNINIYKATNNIGSKSKVITLLLNKVFGKTSNPKILRD